MARPNLLLCFDAFGTLFRPVRPVAKQYAEVARQCGVVNFSDDELQSSLGSALKKELKENPNYGKATGLGAKKWWTNVIHNTFTPFLPKEHTFPQDLAPRLLHRFACKEGYTPQPNLVAILRSLRQASPHKLFHRIAIGVITNSDDRVPDIISSFGVKVSPLRYGTEMDHSTAAASAAEEGEEKEEYDIDFHCMSYDVGVEKPDRLIFDAAELMLTQIIATRDGKTPEEARSDVGTWRKVYVGDEYAKDVVGSKNAGWNPVLLDPEDESSTVPRLENGSDRGIDELFEEQPAVRVRSIEELTAWLTGGERI